MWWWQNIYRTQAHLWFFMILFGSFDFILLFVCQICHVDCETDHWNKIFFKKTHILPPTTVHQIVETILRYFCYGKISSIALIPVVQPSKSNERFVLHASFHYKFFTKSFDCFFYSSSPIRPNFTTFGYGKCYGNEGARQCDQKKITKCL